MSISVRKAEKDRVELPEDYPYSSHPAYLVIEPEGVVDVDPVLRLFDRSKEIARERFREFVDAGIGREYPEEFDTPCKRAAFLARKILLTAPYIASASARNAIADVGRER